MKILFISHCAGLNGAPIVLLHLQRWLKNFSDLDFGTIFRTGGGLVPSFLELQKPIILDAMPKGGVESMNFFDRLKRRILKFRTTSKSQGGLNSLNYQDYDLIYSNTITNGEVVERLRRFGVRVITHVHELDYWFHASGAANWDLVKAHTDVFIACSGAVAEMLESRHGIPANQIETIHEFVPVNCVEVEREEIQSVRRGLGIPDNAFMVVSSGYESQRKGKDLLVSLAKECRSLERGDTPFYFVWVGYRGDQESRFWFEYDAKKLGVADRIKWTGETTEPHKLFAAADAFAMLSREDPFPLVCLEAGLCGKPIVCFAEAGGIPEFVEKDAGFIVPYLDLRGMAARLMELSDNPALAKAMGETARSKVISRYAVDVQAPQILKIIERELCLARSHVAGPPGSNS